MRSILRRLTGAFVGSRAPGRERAAALPEADVAAFEHLEPRLLLSASLLETESAAALIGDAASGGTDAGAIEEPLMGGGFDWGDWGDWWDPAWDLDIVPPPSTPEGPDTGLVGEELSYTTEGTDPLDYKFDWGDGHVGDWESRETTQSHTYDTPGTYYIRAKEKCPLDFFETDWSDPKEVVITSASSSVDFASYAFDGDATDDGDGAYTGTLLGSATFANGQVNQAVNLDGVDDAVDLGTLPGLNFSGTPDMTVMAWVSADSLGNYDAILSNSEGGSASGVRFSLQHVNGRLGVLWGDGTSYSSYYSNAGAFSETGRWYHVAVTVTSGGELRLFVDGEQTGSTYTLSRELAASTADWLVGCNFGLTKYSWDGMVDELQLHSRTFTAEEIAAEYGQVATDYEQLAAQYALDGDAADSSGNGNTGVVNGATFTDGYSGEAASLDGVDDYVDLGTLSNLDQTGRPNMTVTAWVNPDTLQNYDAILSNAESGSATGVRFSLEHVNGRLRVVWGDGTTYNTYYSAAGALSATGQWYHVAVTTTSAGELRLFVNGEQSGSTGTISRDLAASTETWKIGRNYNNARHSWDGLVDEVEIYGRALTADEIDAAHDGLAAHYAFDGDATDASGNGNTGTGDLTYAAGHTGQAVDLDGVDDAVDLGTLSDLDQTGRPNMTVAAWVNPDTLQNYDAILSNAESGSATGTRFSLEYVNGRLRVVWGDGAGYSTYTSAAGALSTPGQWYHVAVTTASTGELRIYVNGVQSGATGTITRDLAASAATWKVGRNYNNAKHSWDGLIDDLRLHSRTLSAAEIAAIYTA